MTKLEQMIVKAVAEKHELPEDQAARWVREALENGTMSVYFDLVAPSAMEVLRPLWLSIHQVIDAYAPLLADVEPPRRRCVAAAQNANIDQRPSDPALVCPMSGNVTRDPITCAWCGQTSTTPEQS